MRNCPNGLTGRKENMQITLTKERVKEAFFADQKKKVLIAKSFCEPAHLYAWDEPLNYIDVYSRMQIEQLILDFAPTMLIVEHDTVFAKKVGTKIVTL